MGQPSPLDLYNLACAYANLSALVNPASSPPTAADQKALSDRAMGALRQSLAAGMNDFALIDRDHDLDPLRERLDFQSLIAESAGRIRELVPLLVTASAANPKDTFLSLRVAALQAWFAQDDELAATRQRVLAFASSTPAMITAERAAKVCTIVPTTDKATLDTALALARKAVELGKGGQWNLLTLGIVEYRAGNYAAADQALLAAADAGKATPTVPETAAFFRAMSLFRQDKPDEARKLATATAAQMKPLPADEQNPLAGNTNHDDLILWMAYKEAKALIHF
jgi:tetratricopeptide (TPR) repeat protein